MALEGVLEPVLEQEAERDVERDDQRDGGREGGVELLLRRPRPLPVEVEARQRRAPDLLPGGRGDGRGREPRRRHQRLLRARDDDVEAPLVHLQRHRAEARDGVDDDERAGILRDRRERLDVGDDAGRRLRVDEEDERDGVDRVELGPEIVGRRRLAPRVAELLDLAAVRARHRDPALAERAGRDGQHALAGRAEADDRRLERTRPRAGEEEHVALRPVHLLQPREHARVDLAEVRCAVVEHRLGQRGEHLRRHRRRPGREQVPLVRHRRTLARRRDGDFVFQKHKALSPRATKPFRSAEQPLVFQKHNVTTLRAWKRSSPSAPRC